jgi:hypothetical protein
MQHYKRINSKCQGKEFPFPVFFSFIFPGFYYEICGRNRSRAIRAIIKAVFPHCFGGDRENNKAA